jgi:hypothetical protein
MQIYGVLPAVSGASNSVGGGGLLNGSNSSGTSTSKLPSVLPNSDSSVSARSRRS